MTTHDLHHMLLQCARTLGILPTPTHRLGVDALRQLNRATGTPFKKLRRWNSQRNYRLAHDVKKRACFTDKDGRDFLRAMFQQDTRPSAERMNELAETIGVRVADVCKYFRRHRYLARRRALEVAAQDFFVMSMSETDWPGRRACAWKDVDAEAL